MPIFDSGGLLRLRRWARNGAIFGMAMAAIDAMFPTWRGHTTYVPWTYPDGVAANMGHLVGAVMGGAFLFLLAALVVNLVLGFSRQGG